MSIKTRKYSRETGLGISTLHVGALLNTGLVKYFCHIKLSDSDVVRKHGVADKPGRGNFVPGKLGQQSVK